MNKTLLASLAAMAICIPSGAQTEVIKITFHDGTEKTFNVADVKEMTFAEVEPASPAQSFAGVYTGTQSLTVGGMYTYDIEMNYTLTAEADGSLTVYIPSYTIPETMMGDLTLGELTIKGLTYDEEKGGFYRHYAADGLKQHFKAISGGTATFDKDYELGGESNILIVADGDNGIKVTNPFKLGSMPFPLEAAFKGTK